jgi:hypothetical protein
LRGWPGLPDRLEGSLYVAGKIPSLRFNSCLRERESARSANRASSAHDHRGNGYSRIRMFRTIEDLEFMGKERLIDHPHGAPFEPHGSEMHTLYQHLLLPPVPCFYKFQILFKNQIEYIGMNNSGLERLLEYAVGCERINRLFHFIGFPVERYFIRKSGK